MTDVAFKVLIQRLQDESSTYPKMKQKGNERKREKIKNGLTGIDGKEEEGAIRRTHEERFSREFLFSSICRVSSTDARWG